VTLGLPERAAPRSDASRRTAPTARISLRALELNLRAVLSGSPNAMIDVRADAWGHGAAAVAQAAVQSGARALLVDDDSPQAVSGLPSGVRSAQFGEATSPYAVYGLSPGFTPVLSLSGWVLSLKTLRAGEGVSYGYTHRAARDTTIALVSGGYAQGVVRSLGNSASVSIGGTRHPIIGRVAMDVCVVDVGHEAIAAGQEVVFFGDPATGAPSIAEWTAATGLTAAELVTAVGHHCAREYGA
jgi:alanine racemase